MKEKEKKGGNLPKDEKRARARWASVLLINFGMEESAQDA